MTSSLPSRRLSSVCLIDVLATLTVMECARPPGARRSEPSDLVRWPGPVSTDKQTPRESIKVIDAALDAGASHLDTANSYGAGHNETRLGKALAGRRGQVVLATKSESKSRGSAGQREYGTLWRRASSDWVSNISTSTTCTALIRPRPLRNQSERAESSCRPEIPRRTISFARDE